MHSMRSRLLHLSVVSALFLSFASLASSQTDSQPAKSSFLNLVIKLRDKGVPEILKAKEVPGRVILRHDRVSDYFYEITKGGSTFAIGFLPEDPFAMRSFRGAEQ